MTLVECGERIGKAGTLSRMAVPERQIFDGKLLTS